MNAAIVNAGDRTMRSCTYRVLARVRVCDAVSCLARSRGTSGSRMNFGLLFSR